MSNTIDVFQKMLAGGIIRNDEMSEAWDVGLHTICMGASYILLLTGFYVDNGKNLPFWKMSPGWFFSVTSPAVLTK
jgi:hypothetical protein